MICGYLLMYELPV